jgi:hypothetical protein
MAENHLHSISSTIFSASRLGKKWCRKNDAEFIDVVWVSSSDLDAIDSKHSVIGIRVKSFFKIVFSGNHVLSVTRVTKVTRVTVSVAIRGIETEYPSSLKGDKLVTRVTRGYSTLRPIVTLITSNKCLVMRGNKPRPSDINTFHDQSSPSSPSSPSFFHFRKT